jgi:hypothetical protein
MTKQLKKREVVGKEIFQDGGHTDIEWLVKNFRDSCESVEVPEGVEAFYEISGDDHYGIYLTVTYEEIENDDEYSMRLYLENEEKESTERMKSNQRKTKLVELEALEDAVKAAKKELGYEL